MIMFYFVNDCPCESENAKIIVLNDSINSKEKLFEFYGESLKFPYNTVTNFNAFRDVMEELEWLKEREIKIYHESLPLIDENAMKAYLDYLNLIDVEWEKLPERINIIRQYYKRIGKTIPVDSWINRPPKIINIYFQIKLKAYVYRILHDYSWDFRRCISFDEKGQESIDFIAHYPK